MDEKFMFHVSEEEEEDGTRNKPPATFMFLLPTNALLYYTYKMLKYLMIAPTCFGPFGPSTGSLCRTLLKLQFCADIQ